ncbi:MAG: hypothetical protein PHV74_06995 [Dehalococcoidia bacterium]|nr:hypothetical protein [Dehalococcoidia bacterium]
MRLGINVSNDLIERFKPLKNSYNLSQICRDAIEARVEAYEKAVAQANSDGMQSIADRLASDYLKKTVLDWQALGRDAAKEWVKLATLENFEDLFHDTAIRKKSGGELAPFLYHNIIPGTPRFEHYQHKHEDWFSRQMQLDGTSNPYIWAKSEFYHGWFSYATAVWEMMKNRIAEKSDQCVPSPEADARHLGGD